MSSGGSGGRLGSDSGLAGGELVPVALGQQSEAGGGLGFSVTAGGQGGRLALVKRVWDRRQCVGLQPGDAIVKINGADVQSLSFAQVCACVCVCASLCVCVCVMKVCYQEVRGEKVRV